MTKPIISWQSGAGLPRGLERKPTFTRRHYEALAEFLSHLAVDPRVTPGRAHLPMVPLRESKAEYHERIVTALCELLKKDNPRFRPEAFRATMNRRD